MSEFEIFECSPKAKALIVSDGLPGSDSRHGNAKFPFKKLNVGQCFTVKFDENIKALRANISRLNKNSIEKFVLIRHDDFKCYEVARIE